MRKVKQAEFVSDQCKVMTLPYSDEVRYCQRHACYVMTCDQCGREFHTDRPHTWTCGDKCRKARSRRLTALKGGLQNV